MNYGTIITFYSFKGGTGRTMALANMACWLAKQHAGSDKKILVMDWDLEAPGLHKFFPKRSEKLDSDDCLGIIDYFYYLRTKLDQNPDLYKKLENEDGWKVLNEEFPLDDYLVKDLVTDPGSTENIKPRIDFFKSGKFSSDYGERVASFDWVDFYNKYREAIISFKQLLIFKYAYSLVDSRTGFTDVSGICTMIFPERLVAVFTPNEQSIQGLVDMLERSIDYRIASDDYRPLVVFPLASRVDKDKFDLRRKWREIYREEFEALFKRAYEITECNLSNYFKEIQIPHNSDLAYGERIALIEEEDDSLSLHRPYRIFFEQFFKMDNACEKFESEDGPVHHPSLMPKILLRNMDQDSILNHYKAAIKSSPFITRSRLYRLFEKGLLSDTNKCLHLDKEDIKKEFKISEDILNRLLQSDLLHIIYKDNYPYYRLNESLIESVRKFEKERRIKKVGIQSVVVLISVILFLIINYSVKNFQINELYKEIDQLKIELKLDQVIDKYNEIIQRDNKKIEPYLALGQLYEKEGRFEEAGQIYRRAISNNINNSDIYYKLAQTFNKRGELYDRYGENQYAHDAWKIAIENYQKAIEISPEMFVAYQDIGDIHKRENNYKEAITYYEKALNIDAKNAKIYKEIGICYAILGNVERALAIYKRAIQEDNKYAFIYHDIAESLKAEDISKAERLYEIASAVDYKNAQYYFYLGYDFQMSGKYDKAIREYNRVIQIDPAYTYAYKNTADVYISRQEYDKAVENYKKAVLSNPDSPYILGQSGILYYNYLYEFSKGYDLLEKAYRLEPEDFQIRLNFAVVSLLVEDFDQAYAIANELLNEKNDLSEEDNLVARLVSISSLFFEKKENKAYSELGKWLEYYKKLPLGYKVSQSLKGISNFINKTNQLSKKEKGIINQLIEIIQSPKSEESIKRLE